MRVRDCLCPLPCAMNSERTTPVTFIFMLPIANSSWALGKNLFWHQGTWLQIGCWKLLPSLLLHLQKFSLWVCNKSHGAITLNLLCAHCTSWRGNKQFGITVGSELHQLCAWLCLLANLCATRGEGKECSCVSHGYTCVCCRWWLVSGLSNLSTSMKRLMWNLASLIYLWQHRSVHSQELHLFGWLACRQCFCPVPEATQCFSLCCRCWLCRKVIESTQGLLLYSSVAALPPSYTHEPVSSLSPVLSFSSSMLVMNGYWIYRSCILELLLVQRRWDFLNSCSSQNFRSRGAALQTDDHLLEATGLHLDTEKIRKSRT